MGGACTKKFKALENAGRGEYTAQKMPTNYHAVQVQEVSELLSKSLGISKTTGHVKVTRASK